MGTLVAIFHTVHAATQTIKYSNFLHTCATTGRSPAIAWVFITPAIYEFTLFALTLVRAVRDARSKIITTDKRTPFLFIIYRDGFYYFGAIFGVHVWNAYLCATQPMAGVFMGIHFAWGLMSVMTCRIYLNLVQAANRGTETDFLEPHSSLVPISYELASQSESSKVGSVTTLVKVSTMSCVQLGASDFNDLVIGAHIDLSVGAPNTHVPALHFFHQTVGCSSMSSDFTMVSCSPNQVIIRFLTA
ncbi:hypothetical protein FRC19_010260 [Serendipita sp. 401]|nr:hypothetical protein FRC19_010260 [Serendipita sp. 401]